MSEAKDKPREKASPEVLSEARELGLRVNKDFEPGNAYNRGGEQRAEMRRKGGYGSDLRQEARVNVPLYDHDPNRRETDDELVRLLAAGRLMQLDPVTGKTEPSLRYFAPSRTEVEYYVNEEGDPDYRIVGGWVYSEEAQKEVTYKDSIQRILTSMVRLEEAQASLESLPTGNLRSLDEQRVKRIGRQPLAGSLGLPEVVGAQQQ